MKGFLGRSLKVSTVSLYCGCILRLYTVAVYCNCILRLDTVVYYSLYTIATAYDCKCVYTVAIPMRVVNSQPTLHTDTSVLTLQMEIYNIVATLYQTRLWKQICTPNESGNKMLTSLSSNRI